MGNKQNIKFATVKHKGNLPSKFVEEYAVNKLQKLDVETLNIVSKKIEKFIDFFKVHGIYDQYIPGLKFTLQVISDMILDELGGLAPYYNYNHNLTKL